MTKGKKRPYKSLARERQADDTRRRIVDATQQLLETEGYAHMTIEAIARKAEVSAPSVYAIFKSKAGILAELINRSTFGSGYTEALKGVLNARDPEERLRMSARIARQAHDGESKAFDLLRGAGMLAPRLAQLEKKHECMRYERQKHMITFLHGASRLLPELDQQTARDIFWVLTGRDLYRMLVYERGWSSQQYEDWLADTLARSLITTSRSAS